MTKRKRERSLNQLKPKRKRQEEAGPRRKERVRRVKGSTAFHNYHPVTGIVDGHNQNVSGGSSALKEKSAVVRSGS